MNMQNVARVLLAALFISAANAEMRVWEGSLTLPTYEEGAPDPNPPFDLFATNRFNYPYTLRENLTGRRTDHAWRAVYLENEYLKCSVLPDIGGHLYTCVDKLSGKPMFYANPSIKKANIGYRGAWAAFGVEFNFPVSHNWVSMSPVSFAYSKHDDGSASVTVGNIDRVYGMEWMVEMILRPGSTLLEERVTLSNRGDVRHRFYWWNNGAVEVWDDSHIEYPMRFAASHGFTEIQPWPVDTDGADLSIVRNQTKGPVSLFVHGSREPFMGIWNPRTNTGTVHFADYAELPAKKIWSWGVDADGLDWRRALSDNNSAYAEVQAGLFRNQETYAFLEPLQTIRFSEFWMPVRGTGGISRANLSGVVYLSREGNAVRALLNVNERLRGASIRLSDGNRSVLKEQQDLSPDRTWAREVAAEAGHPLTFELKDAAGTTLLRHKEGEYDWTPADQIRVGPQPTHEFPPNPRKTEDDWLQLGMDQELNGKLLEALTTYDHGIAKYPESLGLRKAEGRLAASLSRSEEAIRYLEPVHDANTSDPETSYYLGVAYEELGETSKAREAFEAAHRMPQFRQVGALRLGELAAQDGRLQDAARYLAESLRSEPSLRAAEELIAIRRATGDEQGAKSLATDWLREHPLSYFLLEEIQSPDLSSLGADPYRVLNVASEYMRLGLYREALTVLSRPYPASPPDHSDPGSVLPQDHPLVVYYRGYCKQRLGMAAAHDYAAASKLSTLYVFPNSPETVRVLRAALEAGPSDGAAHYLLGTFFFSRGLTESALREWDQARRLAPMTPVLHSDIGAALLRVRHDYSGALSAFQDGLAADATNPKLYAGMDQALSLLRRPASQRVQALERYPNPAQMPSELIYELALNLAEAGDFTRARRIFENRFFPREEGGTNVRQVWIEVLLEQALQLETAKNCLAAQKIIDNLGAEMPGLAFTRDGMAPFIDSARIQYVIGSELSACGRSADAKQHFERAAAQTGTGEISWAYRAAVKLGTASQPEWNQKLETALAHAEMMDADNSVAAYRLGCIELALGRREAAEEQFEQALLLPDRLMAHHLTRRARAWTASGASIGALN
jgi:tetratricopeptide (TPR) repeat protein